MADANPYPNYITPEEEQSLLPPGLSPPVTLPPGSNIGNWGPPDAPPISPGTMGPSGGGNNQFIQQFMQWLQGMSGGGGLGGPPQGIPGGGIPISPQMLGMGGMGGDPLGLGGGADPLGMGNMLMGGGFGLNPAQAAGLRLRRNNEMNALRQNMANAHRGVGRFGGTDFSRHVQNIDDEILALSEQKVQDNIKNALAYNDQLQRYGQQNLANNQLLAKLLGGGYGNLLRYGQDDQQTPGTFSGGEGGDQQGTLP